VISAPLFRKQGDVNGFEFVMRNYPKPSDPHKIDIYVKIYLKANGVVAWLKRFVNDVD